jgi:hypothetical protein
MDDILIAIILAGIGLSGAYLRAELVLHRRLTAALRRREVLQRELHIQRVRPEQNAFWRRTLHIIEANRYQSLGGAPQKDSPYDSFVTQDA